MQCVEARRIPNQPIIMSLPVVLKNNFEVENGLFTQLSVLRRLLRSLLWDDCDVAVLGANSFSAIPAHPFSN